MFILSWSLSLTPSLLLLLFLLRSGSSSSGEPQTLCNCEFGLFSFTRHMSERRDVISEGRRDVGCSRRTSSEGYSGTKKDGGGLSVISRRKTKWTQIKVPLNVTGQTCSQSEKQTLRGGCVHYEGFQPNCPGKSSSLVTVKH